MIDPSEQLARSIEHAWYSGTTPEHPHRVFAPEPGFTRERRVRCCYVFTPNAGPDLAYERCPVSTLHDSGLCAQHRHHDRRYPR